MKHFYKEIIPAYPNEKLWFTYEKIYNMVVENAKDGDKFVEIGAWLGRSTAYLMVEIINSGKDIQLDVIDTFAGNGDIELYIGTRPFLKENNFNVFSIFKKNMQDGGVWDRINVKQNFSLSTVNEYKDKSLDFVFIDGNHYEVGLDLAAWYPKIKNGGILGGDDLFYWNYSRFPEGTEYNGISMIDYPTPHQQIIEFLWDKEIHVIVNENGPWWIEKGIV
jgi:hypothetical protein|tara:strand:+ start:93 stop:752 length:660 start_codon:yes stop_codon:yes gene_type:complete